VIDGKEIMALYNRILCGIYTEIAEGIRITCTVAINTVKKYREYI
jgi:hypothetical protein